MERNEVELHAVAAEIADLDGVEYDQALAKAQHELEDVQQYARNWDQEAAVPSVEYLHALATLQQGARLTPEQVQALIMHDQVVRYLWRHVTDVTLGMESGIDAHGRTA